MISTSPSALDPPSQEQAGNRSRHGSQDHHCKICFNPCNPGHPGIIANRGESRDTAKLHGLPEPAKVPHKRENSLTESEIPAPIVETGYRVPHLRPITLSIPDSNQSTHPLSGR